MLALYLMIIISLAFFFSFTAIGVLREYKERKIQEEIEMFETMTAETSKELNNSIKEQNAQPALHSATPNNGNSRSSVHVHSQLSSQRVGNKYIQNERLSPRYGASSSE